MGSLYKITMCLAQLILLVCVLHTTVLGSCPHGWVDGGPYSLGCVQFNGTKTYNWNDAQEFCFTQDESNLVEIFNQAQQGFLVEMAFQIQEFTGENRHWWIGATDVASEGEWFWPKSREEAKYTSWNNGQPNNGPNYNYVIMNYAMEFNWDDTAHSSSYYPICQKL